MSEGWAKKMLDEMDGTSALREAIDRAERAEDERDSMRRERDEARAETQRLIELNRSHVATLCEAQRNQVEALKAEVERLQTEVERLRALLPNWI